ncbi:DUF4468 domain-containing protein [Myroides odoratimimus]|uniref:DUF4468 domain-containing protein n=1 Tax=Myroides odoratimimus TaxID=76832 RepID=UPI0025753A80|nr:DUF4468 domain-containing protein [Myroides odoratimimus]MDM1093407.1 DUF4468 domain-containing protein [Myroides odoratimimus]
MKNIILIILLLSIKGYSQKLIRDEVSGMYKLDTIVNTSLNKEALYSNALGWFNSNFRDSRNVVESKDLETGEILFHGITSKDVPIEYKVNKKVVKDLENVKVHFKGKVIVKDSKYRLIFSDLKHEYISGMIWTMYPEGNIEDNLPEYETYRLLEELQNSFIRSMDKKPDNDF